MVATEEIVFFLGGSLLGLIMGLAGNVAVTAWFRIIDDYFENNNFLNWIHFITFMVVQLVLGGVMLYLFVSYNQA